MKGLVKKQEKVIRSTGEKICHEIVFIIFVIYSISLLYPFFFLLMNSFKASPVEMLKNPLGFPESFSFKPYQQAFKMMNIGEMYFNTITLAVGQTFVSMALTCMAAYAINDLQGHIYAIPEYTSITGFVYNKDLFNQYGWQIPNTTKELKELCDKILADTNGSVAPITWCEEADGYLYYAAENWLSQYEGIANMNKFYEYSSPEIYALEDNSQGSIGTGKSLALSELVKFFKPMNEGGYARNDSRVIKAKEAQYAIIEGSAAMMLNGSWFENEMTLYLEDENIGLFAVPELSDENGNVLRSATYTSEGDKRVLTADYSAYYFIPTMATNKQGALDFLLYLSSEEACEIYTQYAKAVRPFVYDVSKTSELYSKVGTFGQSVMDMAHQHYLYAPISQSALTLKGKGGLWPYNGRVEGKLLAKGAETNPEYWLELDYDHATENWSDWMELIGQ